MVLNLPSTNIDTFLTSNQIRKLRFYAICHNVKYNFLAEITPVDGPKLIHTLWIWDLAEYPPSYNNKIDHYAHLDLELSMLPSRLEPLSLPLKSPGLSKPHSCHLEVDKSIGLELIRNLGISWCHKATSRNQRCAVSTC